jgi:GDP-mannose 6-dehydrogenase
MKVSVLGLGYVGTVSAACLASRGHRVFGVDVEPRKVNAINEGRAPVIEPGLDQLIQRVVSEGSLTAQTDPAAAVRDSDVSLVCVGTPGRDNGALDLGYLTRVAEQIGEALARREDRHVVTFRSTMVPGTVEDTLIPILERASKMTAGHDFGVAVNPEFLREGSSLRDFDDPPRIVVGESDQASGAAVMSLYDGIDAPRVRTAIRSAEVVKYADNCFHALKIAFANEIGNICKHSGIDARTVMEIFCLDTKLNLSPVYLKPGSAFGGSCLPKDVRALLHHARELDLVTPVLASVLDSNDEQKRSAFELIRKLKKKKIGILGMSFKPDTDDLRESPAVELIESLIGKGYDVAIYDRNVSLARLIGANRVYIEKEIPHVSRLLRASIEEVVAHAEVVVVTTKDPSFREIARGLPADKTLVDLVGLLGAGESPPSYEGICW